MITSHDDLALNFMDACKKRDVSVPEDFAVIGHGNNSHGSKHSSSQSTTSFSVEWKVAGMVSHALGLCSGLREERRHNRSLVFHVREPCGVRRNLRQQDVEEHPWTISDFCKSRDYDQYSVSEQKIPVCFD